MSGQQKMIKHVEKPSKVRETIEKDQYMNLNDAKYLGKKIKRNIEDSHTNDSTHHNNLESEQDSQNFKLKENKNIIYFESAHNIKYADIRRIFLNYGKLTNIRVTKKKYGWVIFSQNRAVHSAMKEKQIIFNKEKLNISDKKIDNKREYKKKKSKHSSIELENPKKSNDENIEEIEEISSEENISEKNESWEDDDILEENSKNVIITKSKQETTIDDLKKKLDELIKSNSDSKKKINELIDYKKKNEADKVKFLKVIGALNEINYQNQQYIKYNLNIKLENLKLKFDLLLGSYKILFIRKTANIFLYELFTRYSKYFKQKGFRINHNKKHSITICVKDIKGVNSKVINLIVDFLKFIKIKTSSMIHIQDKNFKFQKEILYEALEKETSDNKESGLNISLNEAMNIIFQKKKQEEKDIPKKDENFYNNMKKLILCELDKNNNSDEKKKNPERYDEDNSEKEFDKKIEETRIKNILSGDENSINMNLSFTLNQLLNKIKLNQERVEPDKKLKEMKIIDGDYFFNSWKESFEKEEIKSNKTYKLYVDKDNIGSLANMGAYLRILLNGLNFNFYMNEPNKLDKVLSNDDKMLQVKKHS